MGDEDAAAALLGEGRFEGRAVEALRRGPADDPRLDRARELDRDLASGRPGTRRGRGGRTSRIPARRSSTHVWRSSRGCRRSGCSTRCGRRATRGRLQPGARTRRRPAPRPSRRSASRRRRPLGLGGLRHVHTAVGVPARAAGGAGPFVAAALRGVSVPHAAVTPSAARCRLRTRTAAGTGGASGSCCCGC